MGKPFLGVQLGSHSVYDEGADHCLDTLQETAGVNAVFVYAQTTHGGFARGRKLSALAHDHGVAPRDPAPREMTRLWFTPHDRYYAGTPVRYDALGEHGELAGSDIFAELQEPCRKRGIGLYARILEGFSKDLVQLVPNWTRLLTVDVYGRITQLPCWNNPGYRAWWVSTVEDLFKSYPLDGYKWGSERSGPLSNTLFGAARGGIAPTCFCEHCLARARTKGIDAERARLGYQHLFEMMSGLAGGGAAPHDGILIGLLRLLLKYPEILAWEAMFHESREAVARLQYGAIKQIKPEAQVGWHVYHHVSWDPFYRAEMDYAEIAEYSDWIKPVVYHDVAGPRIRRHIFETHARFGRELSEEQLLGVLYATMGYDPKREPTLGQLDKKGLSPEYVYRETKRCVDAVAGRAAVYAGVGFDIPWMEEHFPSAPETTYKATVRAFEAGASGLVISREYDEMRLDNLKAVGRAVKDAWKG
jgi:hypothetical protein